MRIPSLAAACAVSIAMLAGCSTQTQGTGGLPIAAPGGAGASSGHPMNQYMPHHKLSQIELLKLQAEGTIPGPAPVSVMKQIYKRIKTHGQTHLKVHGNAANVAVWVADTNDNYLVGQKKNLTKTVATILTPYNDCFDPVQIKVDHSRNIWAGCEGSPSNTGAVAEWNSDGSPVANYTTSCPTNWHGCQGGQYYNYGSWSSAADASHVFAGVEFQYGEYCATTSFCYFTGAAGVEWWPAGQPSATPTLIQLPNPAIYPYVGVDDFYYMDEDNSGNLWFTYYGCTQIPLLCGTALGEISNPTSPSWTFTVIETPLTYQCAGGVYVSNAGTVLNVTDPCTRVTYQYGLPVLPGAYPMNVLGPTPQNAFGLGAPVSGGFSQNDSKMILADSYGWLDRGEVSTNKWKAKASPSVQDPLSAAFTPSDK